MDFRTLCVQCGSEHHKKRRRSPSDRDLLFGKPLQLDLGSIIENDIHKKKGKSEARGGNKKGINSLTHQGNTKLVYNQIDGLIRVPEKALEKSTVAEPLPEVTPKTHKKTTVKRKIDEYIENQLGDNTTHEDQPLEVFPTIVVPDIAVAQEDTALRSLVLDYLKNVVKVSNTLYLRDVEKAKRDRFIITGLHESLHYVRHNKVLFMCIAEDIIDMTEDGYTNSMINTFVKECKQYGILLLQCFNKKKLARIFKRGKIVSCICVLKSQRAITDSWKVLVNFIKERKYFSFCCYTLFVDFLPLF